MTKKEIIALADAFKRVLKRRADNTVYNVVAREGGIQPLLEEVIQVSAPACASARAYPYELDTLRRCVVQLEVRLRLAGLRKGRNARHNRDVHYL